VAECVPVSAPLEVSKPVSLDLTLVAATAGLPITAEQFRGFLSQEDLAEIEAGFIPVECLRAYAERFSKRLSTPPAGALVCCGDCQHFERIDHPHTGKCARGHGQHYLWDRDARQCGDFVDIEQAKGDSERDKGAGARGQLGNRKSVQRFFVDAADPQSGEWTLRGVYSAAPAAVSPGQAQRVSGEREGHPALLGLKRTRTPEQIAH
jgi:hypothetical protein